MENELQADHCVLCSLLCDLNDQPACAIRDQWLTTPRAWQSPTNGDLDATELAGRLCRASQPLIWIDSADVNTTRAAVNLAAELSATIHVGGNSGDSISHRVLSSERWLGTTLAEVPSRADVIVTVGNTLLSEMPQVVPRYIRSTSAASKAEWLHIAESRPELADSPDVWISWPRNRWYANLTALLMELNQSGGSTGIPEHLHRLASQLSKANYGVIIWNTNEFIDGIEELIVRRLASVARLLSEHTRVSLLGLQQSPGRLTAHETLLWLTGATSTAHWRNDHWEAFDQGVGLQMDQWSAMFDSILVVRSLPSLVPLPQFPTGASGQLATYLVAEGERIGNAADGNSLITQVSGVDDPAVVFRGDGGIALNCGVSSQSDLPTAEKVLRDCRAVVAQLRGGSNAG